MSGIELVGFVVATGLMAYLIVAFLKPEWFA
jgi:K+-transporting ATPase KdpF subunit